ncbi:MAG: hypothetical protein A2051_02995 [Desulfovibrionales bacterium GWA2_65_9]|nr:MAG: hypothetical protein A2051_02995 [Desulfovibrionales bacterium GWA2_65_9]
MGLAAGVEFSSAAALRGCIMNGLGVSILPELAVRADVAAGRLVVLPWSTGEGGGDGSALETAVLMLRHKDKWLSPPLAAFMDLVRAGLMSGSSPERGPLRAPAQKSVREMVPLLPEAPEGGGSGRCC